MKKIWFDEAWEDYLYWQSQNKKTLRRINLLLKDIERSNFDGIGKPEPLKGELSGFCAGVLMTLIDLYIVSAMECLKYFHVGDIMMIKSKRMGDCPLSVLFKATKKAKQ